VGSLDGKYDARGSLKEERAGGRAYQTITRKGSKITGKEFRIAWGTWLTLLQAKGDRSASRAKRLGTKDQMGLK